MQEENTLNANLILSRLKKALKINRDIQLSEFLNVRPNTISTWKKRNTLDYNAIISICELYEIDLNEIFLEKKAATKENFYYIRETPLISREVQFQYCFGNPGIMDTLPKYNFPFIKADKSRAFQVTSNNMFPIIEENSFAICEETDIKEVEENALVVIVSKSKGLFINRISHMKDKKNVFLLASENTFFNNVTINIDDINEIWLIKGILSYNINSESKFKFLNDSLNKINKAMAKDKS